MGKFTEDVLNDMLDHVFGNASYVTTCYIGLSTTTITDPSTDITEPTGNNYSRKAVTNNPTNFPAASAGAKSNGADILFDTPSGSWGEITDFFIATSASGGDILAFDALDDGQTVNTGNVVKFAAGDLDLSLT